jgi:hypothetical protein
MSLSGTPHRLARALIGAAWGWVFLVGLLTFWGAWEIPARMPDINEVATTHLFLFPVSLVLFLALSWLRKSHDDAEANPWFQSVSRWRATVGVWVLLLLHPVSCGLYPAVFNLDTRTVEDIRREVAKLQVGAPRADVEKLIGTLNATLPVSMGTDLVQHRVRQAEVVRYLTERDPATRKALWPRLSRATFVFMPWGLKPGEEPDLAGREQVFLRRSRATSDIGVDKIKVRYGRGFVMEEMVYSSNRQLTENRGTCTIHLTVPAPPEASFPYPCPP